MNMMVTLPAEPEEREALHARASQLHAEAVREILEARAWSAAEKTARLQQLILQIKGKTGAAPGNHECKMTKL